MDKRIILSVVVGVFIALAVFTVVTGWRYFTPWGYACGVPETHSDELSEQDIRRAWKRAFDEVGGGDDLCEAMEGAVVHVRVHNDSPAMCTPGVSPLGSCVQLRGPTRYPVEVNVARIPGNPKPADVLAHEFTHIVMSRVGWDLTEHHRKMWDEEGCNAIVLPLER